MPKVITTKVVKTQPQKVVVTNVQARKNPRRRNRRGRNAIKLMQSNVGMPLSGGTSSLRDFYLNNDATLQKSVHDLIQTLFFPHGGIHRGVSSGSTLTALTRWKSSFDFTVPAYNTGSVIFLPNQVATTQFLAYNYTIDGIALAPDVTIYSPLDSSAKTKGVQTLNGPFYVSGSTGLNPSSNSFRTVSGTMRIIPAASVTNVGGEYCIGYEPAIVPNSTSAYMAEFNRTVIDQLPYSRSFKGSESAVAHWIPSEDEQDMDQLANGAFCSALCMYYINGTSNAQVLRIEVEVGIEYVPSPLYKPFVQQKLPAIHPDAWYHLNQFVTNQFADSMVSTYGEYIKMAENVELSEPGHTAVTYYGSGGANFRQLNYDKDISDEVKRGGPWWKKGLRIANRVAGIAYPLAQTYCSMLPESPFCSMLGRGRQIADKDYWDYVNSIDG